MGTGGEHGEVGSGHLIQTALPQGREHVAHDLGGVNALFRLIAGVSGQTGDLRAQLIAARSGGDETAYPAGRVEDVAHVGFKDGDVRGLGTEQTGLLAHGKVHLQPGQRLAGRQNAA